MQITIFSVWMTFLWSSVLILGIYILRKRSVLLNLCSMSGVILFYLFCIVRLLVPVELPWTKVVVGGKLYNWLYNVASYNAGTVKHPVPVFTVVLEIWAVVAVFLIGRYALQYRRTHAYFGSIPAVWDPEICQILEEIQSAHHSKYKIDIVQTAAVDTPCCIGIFDKRILIPDKKYSHEEMYYILLHEYTHLHNNDILTRQLMHGICMLYWWNPLVYVLKKELCHSLEIRCDQTVVSKLKPKEKAAYLQVILNAFCGESKSKVPHKIVVGEAGLVETHSREMIERFQFVAHAVPERHAVLKCMVSGMFALTLLLTSYLWVLQPSYEAPEEDIIGDPGFAYEFMKEDTVILKKPDGRCYLKNSGFQELFPIAEEAAVELEQEGFSVKQVE